MSLAKYIFPALVSLLKERLWTSQVTKLKTAGGYWALFIIWLHKKDLWSVWYKVW